MSDPLIQHEADAFQDDQNMDAVNCPIVKEAIHTVVGDVVGQCKWFSDKLGYGFITIQTGDNKGKDIFVHHSGVKPLNSNYKTLKKGEYVSFILVDGDNGQQAVNVTGIGGGSLMCDIIPLINRALTQQPPPPFGVPLERPSNMETDFIQVPFRSQGPGRGQGRGRGGRGGPGHGRGRGGRFDNY